MHWVLDGPVQDEQAISQGAQIANSFAYDPAEQTTNILVVEELNLEAVKLRSLYSNFWQLSYLWFQEKSIWH